MKNQKETKPKKELDFLVENPVLLYVKWGCNLKPKEFQEARDKKIKEMYGEK
jgi:hypothetical protein